MNKFTETPITKRTSHLRKPIYGVGINDADYRTEMVIEGKRFMCPFYVRWKSILRRCYSEKFHKISPTYKDCSACEEWLVFSKFKAWMVKQDWQGKELDKDILVEGNKVYSPETCLFVSSKINSLFNDCGSKRGIYPQGVGLKKGRGKFYAECSVDGKKVFLGHFDSVELASMTYKKFKCELIKKIALAQSDITLKQALLLASERF